MELPTPWEVIYVRIDFGTAPTHEINGIRLSSRTFYTNTSFQEQGSNNTVGSLVSITTSSLAIKVTFRDLYQLTRRKERHQMTKASSDHNGSTSGLYSAWKRFMKYFPPCQSTGSGSSNEPAPSLLYALPDSKLLVKAKFFEECISLKRACNAEKWVTKYIQSPGRLCMTECVRLKKVLKKAKVAL